METNQPVLIVLTYGNLESAPASDSFITTFLIPSSSLDQARVLAKEFCKVIPDDLESYHQDVDNWDGQEPFKISHQEDDWFHLSVTLVQGSVQNPTLDSDLALFQKFVDRNNADPDH